MTNQIQISHEEANVLIQSIIDNATPSAPNDLAHLLMERMGLDLRLPKTVLIHPCLNYRLGTEEVFGQFPAMVMPLCDKWGNYRAIEVLFLGPPGEVAPVVEPRHIYWANDIEAGVYLPMHQAEQGVLGVAAGLGNAASAHHLTGVPMCAVGSPHDLERFQIPDQVKHLVIFAYSQCEVEAQRLAVRAESEGVTAQVVSPPTANADWLTEFAFRGAIPVDEIADSKSASGDDTKPL